MFGKRWVIHFLPYKDSKDVFILGSPDEIIAALDDSLVTATQF